MHNTESMMAAIDGITLPIILLDGMGAICSFNLGAATLFGITAKHAVGKNINALCSDITMPDVNVQGNTQTYELKARITRTSKSHWLRITSSKAPNVEDSSVLMIIRDITNEIESRKQQNLFQTVTDYFDKALMILDCDYKVIQINKAFTNIFGYTSSEIYGLRPRDKLFKETISPEDERKIDVFNATKEPFDFTVSTLTKTNQEVWANFTCSQMSEDWVIDEKAYYVVFISDVTQAKQLEELKRVGLSMLSTSDPLKAFTSFASIYAPPLLNGVQPKFAMLNGQSFSASRVNELSKAHYVHYSKIPDLHSWLKSFAKDKLIYSTPLTSKSGRLIGLILLPVVHPERLDEHQIEALTILAQLGGLALQHHGALTKIDRLTQYDSLTGLFNSRYMEQFVHQELSKNTDEVAVISLGICNLELITEPCGSQAADKVILETAKRLKTTAGRASHISRAESGEFFLVTKLMDMDSLRMLCEVLLGSTTQVLEVNEYSIEIETCAGIAFGQAENFKALCDQAHIAKNRAHIGTYGFFDEGMNGVSKERLLLSYSLKKAINDSQLKLFYQPQVCPKTMRVMGVEALARWNSPEHGNVSPEKFIQLAEKIGEIDKLTLWAIKTACEQMSHWRSIGVYVPKVSVNLSQLNLNLDGLPLYVERILNAFHLPASCLVLEITETATSELTDDKLNMLRALRDIGVGLSMDDFGTGFSSLANLAALPVTEIKIDKSFVQAIANDNRFSVLVSSIIEIGNKLGLTVVAEGVENKAQLNSLRSYNCQVIQGFIYSKAVTADELTLLVKKNAFNSKIKGIPCASPRSQYDRFTQIPELYFNRTPL